MNDEKISELTELATAADDDLIPIVDSSESETKYIQKSNLVGTTIKSWDVVIINPNSVYSVDTQIPIALTFANISISKIQVSLNTTAQEVAGDVKFADDLTAFTNATLINDFDTTSGVRTDSLITLGSVSSGKFIYLDFDSQPNAAITWMLIHIEYSYT